MGLFGRSNKEKVEDENRCNYMECFDMEKFPVITKEFKIKVKGVTFQNEDSDTDRQLIIEKTAIGTHFMLIGEDDNDYDEYAVRIVRYDGLTIGYFPSISNKEIYEKLDNGQFIDAILIDKPYYDGIYGAVLKIQVYGEK